MARCYAGLAKKQRFLRIARIGTMGIRVSEIPVGTVGIIWNPFEIKQ